MFINNIDSNLTNYSIIPDKSKDYPSNLPAVRDETDKSLVNSSFSSLSKNISNLNTEINKNSEANLGLQDVTKLYSGSSAYKLNDIVSLASNLKSDTNISLFQTAHLIKVENGNPALDSFVNKTKPVYNSNGEDDLNRYFDISKQILSSDINAENSQITKEDTLSAFISKVGEIIENSPSETSKNDNLNNLFKDIENTKDISEINSLLNSFNISATV